MEKSNLNFNKKVFLLVQMAVVFVAMLVLFWVMALGHKEKIIDGIKTRLDASAQAMSSQLKANQVPFSNANAEHGVFIVNQNDGSMVIDRHGDNEAQQKLWERYKTKIIYEMQKQKRGWIEYPDKNFWSLGQKQTVIRYVSIDELNWILAIEEEQPSEGELLKEAVNPSAYWTIFLLLIFSAGSFWFLNQKYFNVFKRQISETVEHNLLSLNGEDKIWGNSPTEAVPQIPENTEPVVDESEVFLNKKPHAIKNDIIPKLAEVEPVLKKSAKKSRDLPSEVEDLTINVNHIKSPVLKKILKQFREK